MKLLRNYIIVLSVIAAVTAGLAVLSVRGYLTRPTIIVVTPEEPTAVSVSAVGYDDLALLLNHAKKNATKLEQSPERPNGYPSYGLEAKTKANRPIGTYSLVVISMINRTAVLEDLQTGEYYRLSVADFGTLLRHEAFGDLTKSLSCRQVLTVGGVGAIPATSSNQYVYSLEGSFVPVPTGDEEMPATQLTMTVEEAAAKPKIEATVPADAWSLTVQKDEATVVTQDRVSASELYFPAEPGDYTYRLTAHWNMTTQRDWYGDRNYVLEIHIAEPEAE